LSWPTFLGFTTRRDTAFFLRETAPFAFATLAWAVVESVDKSVFLTEKQ
jgi:hypothetical protein